MQKKYGKRVGGGLNSQGLFEQIFSLENLRGAFEAFQYGKTKKPDVMNFSKNSQKELYKLYDQLRRKTYCPGPYETFYIQDPKLRKINKAPVRDRVLHHTVFAKLYHVFDRAFIFDSYSCWVGKGTHRAVRRLQEFFNKESANNSWECWVLKCDVKKFFHSIDHGILLGLIRQRVKDENALWLIELIVKSFPAGLPLGNITSQLFANIYLHKLDMFIKHQLGVKYYIRYCDDFVILNRDRDYLEEIIPVVNEFLQNHLKLRLHPNKVTIKKYRQGIDFLGYVSFPRHTVLRLKTKKRMIRKIKQKIQLFKEGIITKKSFRQTLHSYFGLLSHCDAHMVKKEVQEMLPIEIWSNKG